MKSLDLLFYFRGNNSCRGRELVAIILKVILSGKIISGVFTKIFNAVGLVIPNYAYGTGFIEDFPLSDDKIATPSVEIAQVADLAT